VKAKKNKAIVPILFIGDDRNLEFIKYVDKKPQ